MKDIIKTIIVSIGGLITVFFLFIVCGLSNPMYVSIMAVGLFWFSYVIYASIQNMRIRKRLKKLGEE